MKKWLEKKKKNLEDKLKKAEDPQAQKDAKKEDGKKRAERTMKVLKLTKQGIDQYADVAKKVDQFKTGATQKTLDLAEKAGTIAEKVDQVASTLVDKAKNALNGAAKKEGDVKKADDVKPSTGSGIIDLLIPAVPEKEAPKTPKKDEPPKPA